MKSAQRTADDIRNKHFLLSVSPRSTAIGSWLAVFGIFIKVASGATGYPKIPPGIIILAAAGGLVYTTARWRWASLPGILLAGFVSIGVFVTPGTGYRLSHPETLGPFVRTDFQLFGLIIALIAGIATTMRGYLPDRH
jgi:hypothetical protein